MPGWGKLLPELIFKIISGLLIGFRGISSGITRYLRLGFKTLRDAFSIYPAEAFLQEPNLLNEIYLSPAPACSTLRTNSYDGIESQSICLNNSHMPVDLEDAQVHRHGLLSGPLARLARFFSLGLIGHTAEYHHLSEQTWSALQWEPKEEGLYSQPLFANL